MSVHALIIDDDDASLRLAARSLTRAGYRISTRATAPRLARGFQTHLAKPVDPLELAVVVAALAGRTTSFAGRA